MIPRALLCLCALLLLGATAPTVQTLTPQAPADYQTVAEDLLESGDAPLAREVLATGVLVAAESDPPAAAGIAVTLAALADSGEDHAGLWSLAIALDPARADHYRWLAPRSAPSSEPLRAAAETMTMLRRNDPDAPDRLSSDTKDLIIQEVRIGFDRRRVQAVLIKWETDARNDPCRGRMTIRVRQGDAFVIAACPDESHHHGMRLDDDWRMMIAIELALANAAPASWATALAVGLDPPVPAWSLQTLADRYGVSADRPVYRSGRWVAR